MTPIAFLIAWIIRSALLILAGALLLRLCRITNPSLRLTAWTALLVGSLSIPLLTTALPKLPIHLLPAASHQSAAPPVNFTSPPDSAPLNINIAPPPAQPTSIQPIDWMQLVLILYATIAAALIVRLLIGLWLSRAILRRSSPTGLPANRAAIHESHELESPVTAGIIRSAVLLPKDWRAWDATRLNAVLAHESSHARRRDPALQFLSSLHCALLWISPATWLLHRAIVRTGEELSDEDAVAATPDRTTYVEILLDFMQRGAHVNPVEVAMARYDQPKTRIRRILNATADAHHATRAGIASTLALIVPLSCLAAVVYPRPFLHLEAPPAIPTAVPLPELAQVTAPRLPSPPPAPAKLPRFEAATIKPVPSGGMMGVTVFPGGRVVIQHFPLKTLVQVAFETGYWQMEGGDTWEQSELYTVEAKPSEADGARIQNLKYSIFTIEDPTLRKMLQALLMERFHLKVHREIRTGNVYLLERSGGDLRLLSSEIRRAKEGEDAPPDPSWSIGYAGGKWNIHSSSMAQLANFATNYVLRAQVLDRTGLSGFFDYRQLQPDLDPKYGGDQAASFNDFLKETGLKLVRAKGPVETLIIDHAEKPSAD